MEFDDWYEDALEHINQQASPGYPWKVYASTNEKLFKSFPMNALVKHAVSRRLQKWEDRYPEFGLVRVFVKREPHKLKKMRSELYRLISSVSIVDQVIGRMLWTRMDSWLVRNWERTPVKLGFADLHGELSNVLEWLEPPDKGEWLLFDDDKSTWDWTEPLEARDFCMHFRMRIGSLAGESFRHLYGEAYDAASNAVLVTTGGTYVTFDDEKAPKLSGEVKTLSDNSVSQVGLFVMFLREVLKVDLTIDQIMRMIISLGDDTVNLLKEEWIPLYQAFLKSLGLRPKVGKAYPWPSGLTEVEFCSRRALSLEGDYEWTSSSRQMWRLVHESVPACLSKEETIRLIGWQGVLDKLQYWCAMPEFYAYARELIDWLSAQTGGYVHTLSKADYLRIMRRGKKSAERTARYGSQQQR
jgi:hypothetical protein